MVFEKCISLIRKCLRSARIKMKSDTDIILTNEEVCPTDIIHLILQVLIVLIFLDFMLFYSGNSRPYNEPILDDASRGLIRRVALATLIASGAVCLICIISKWKENNNQSRFARVAKYEILAILS